jgi:hypothetical protein
VYYLIFSEAKNKENNYSRRENCVIVRTVIYNFGAVALSTTTFQINLMSLIQTANAEKSKYILFSFEF